MSHPCGQPLPGGGRCIHKIADPEKPNCGRHASKAAWASTAPLDERGCQMRESPPGAWWCLTHDPASPEWKAAVAMGAVPPCRVPGAVASRQGVAGAEPLDPGTAQLLARDPEWRARRILALNRSATAAVLEQLAGDPDDLVRRAVARNSSTPTAVCELLAADCDDNVRATAQKQLRTRSEAAEVAQCGR